MYLYVVQKAVDFSSRVEVDLAVHQWSVDVWSLIIYLILVWRPVDSWLKVEYFDGSNKYFWRFQQIKVFILLFLPSYIDLAQGVAALEAIGFHINWFIWRDTGIGCQVCRSGDNSVDLETSFSWHLPLICLTQRTSKSIRLVRLHDAMFRPG